MTIPAEAITGAYCVQCGQTLPHDGISWRKSARCVLIQRIYAAGAGAERDRIRGVIQAEHDLFRDQARQAGVLPSLAANLAIRAALLGAVLDLIGGS